MQSCNWAFLIKGPSASLECLPQASPWWSLSPSRKNLDWEVFIPGKQHEQDIEKQLDEAMQVITRMNGIAVSSGHSGLIELTHHVKYDAQNNKIVTVPLRVVIKVSTLSGLGPTKRVSVDFHKVGADQLQMLGSLLDYWGQPNSETYEGLYKIYELIHSVAPDLIKEVSRKKLSRLKQTCNNISSGPTARHADPNVPPVSEPLSLAEIRTIVSDLSARFIRSITTPSPQAAGVTQSHASEITG